MARKKNPVVREVNYILLALLFTLIFVLAYGVLFNTWIKDRNTILIWVGYTYAGIIILRLLNWVVKLFNH